VWALRPAPAGEDCDMTMRSRVTATVRLLVLAGVALLVTASPLAADVPPDDPCFFPMDVVDHWTAARNPVALSVWDNGAIPFDVLLGGRLDFDGAVAAAAAAWSDVPDSVLSFDYLGPSATFLSTAVNVYFDPDDESIDLAVSDLHYNYEDDPDVPQSEWRLVRADILLNPNYLWTTSATPDPEMFDVQTVLMHELGHVLGLPPSYLRDPESGQIICGADNGNQVMEPRYEGVRRELSPLDVEMLLGEELAPPIPEPATMTVMLVGMLAALRHRRRR